MSSGRSLTELIRVFIYRFRSSLKIPSQLELMAHLLLYLGFMIDVHWLLCLLSSVLFQSTEPHTACNTASDTCNELNNIPYIHISDAVENFPANDSGASHRHGSSSSPGRISVVQKT